ncbi:MAG: alpha-amylase family glycosyl hydrolase [Tenuifilaceae bacterium]|nr:alpha-amylase family glycosyl hydrolase [Tenuifilaceae bacterium]
MYKKKFFGLFATLAFAIATSAQVTTSPTLPTASDEVVITFNASSSDLAGYTGDVYAHTGVRIEGSTTWRYVIGSWGNNTTQPKLTRVAANTYTLLIEESVRKFYNVPDNESITQMCFVFRSSDASKQTEDIFVDVVKEGLSVKIKSPDKEKPFYAFGSNVTVDVQANSSTSISLFIDGDEVTTSSTNQIEYTHTISNYGLQWVKAVATDGTEEVADSSYFYVLGGDAPVASLPEGAIPGINVTGTDEVTLVLHDPPAKKEFVFAIGDFSDWLLDEAYLMNRTPDGKHHWLTITGLEPAKEYIYQYWIDGEIKLADPYTEKVSDPWNDKFISSTTYPNLISYPEGKTTGIASVFQIEAEEYQWEATNFVAPPKDELIIYELHIRDFVDDDYIITVLDKLDYLETLGVNAIELMPINEFEGNDSWGYNPSFYFATDKAYGTKNSYKKFIDECHKRGMAVIIDMVLNHSFSQSPLVQMYFDGEKPTVDNPWYNQTCPHEPWCWGYDFDHQSPYTIDFVNRVNEFWLTEFKVDGFRFDFTKGFTNNQTGNQGSDYDEQRIGILKTYADYIWEVNPNAYVILEHFTDNTEERELAEYKASEGKGMLIWGNVNHAYSEASMGWLSDSNFNQVSYKQRGYNYPHLVGYMESHDEERMMYKNLTYGNSSNQDHDVKTLGVGITRQKLAGVFFFTIPGPKMIWQFGELGYEVPIDQNGRTGRKPIRWEYFEDGGRRSLYSTWAELIALRKDYPAFTTDNFSVSLAGAGKRITLMHDDMNVVIVGNFDVTRRDISVSFPHTGVWHEYYTQTEVDITNISQTLNMAPSEYRIYTTSPINREDYIVDAPIVENIGKPFDISLWPNPASSQLNVSIYSEKPEKVDIKLYDISGRLLSTIHQGNILQGENTLVWSRPNGIRSGVYFVVINTSSNRVAKRVLFQ